MKNINTSIPKNKLVILGASSQQLPLIKKANEMGIKTFVMDMNSESVGKNYADNFYIIDISNKEKVLNKCKKIDPDGVLTIASEIGNITANYVANELNLVSNSAKTITYTTNKHEMKNMLKSNNIGTSKFGLYNQKIDLDFPFMVKASDRSGSRGVQLVRNKSEYEKAVKEAKEVSFNKKVIIEEYVEGRQYSFEMLSQKGEHYLIGITEEFYSGEPYFVETQHVMPGRIRKSLKNKALEEAVESLNALNIKNGASHIEFRIDKNENIKIIEIASRMGGDYRCYLVKESSGIDYLKLVIQVVLEQKIDSSEIKPKFNRAALIKWILNKKDYNLYKILKENGENFVIDEVKKADIYEDEIVDGTQRQGCFIIKEETNLECLKKVGSLGLKNNNKL